MAIDSLFPPALSIVTFSAFAAVILRLVYGVDLTHGDTRHYELVQELAEIAESISTPGRHAVEAFPALQRLPAWAPGQAFRSLAARWKAELAHVRDQLFDSARARMVSAARCSLRHAKRVNGFVVAYRRRAG